MFIRKLFASMCLESPLIWTKGSMHAHLSHDAPATNQTKHCSIPFCFCTTKRLLLQSWLLQTHGTRSTSGGSGSHFTLRSGSGIKVSQPGTPWLVPLHTGSQHVGAQTIIMAHAWWHVFAGIQMATSWKDNWEWISLTYLLICHALMHVSKTFI